METVMKPVQSGRGRMRCWTAEQKLAVLPEWTEHDNRHAPHSALGMQSPAEFYADGSSKTKNDLSKIKRGSTGQGIHHRMAAAVLGQCGAQLTQSLLLSHFATVSFRFVEQHHSVC